MSLQHRSRNPNWKTRALSATAKELRIRRFRVEVLAGRDQGVVAAADGAELAIGTAPGNQLIATDASVSRHHCVIEAREDGFVVRDLGSTNGTTLGGYRVTNAFLEQGAVIGIGETSLRFEFGDDEIRQSLSAESEFGTVLGGSVAMRGLFSLMERVASANATVLMTGETGTGKGALAEALHQQGSRSAGPFVVVDCGAIPDSLIESELFGHEKGAFTGATEQRIGAFERASGGTIFLDEIGELGIDMQPKLLRVLENRELRRVGGSGTTKIDVRIVAATNRDLREEVNTGGFREDLLYRLNVMHLVIPPLRERRDDIPMLAESFYRHFTKDAGAQPPADLLRKLMRQKFPGNVRELKAAVERSVVLGDLEQTTLAASGAEELDFTQTYREAKESAVHEWELRYIPELVGRYDGNLSRAARAVSMDRNHLRKLLKGIRDDDSK